MVLLEGGETHRRQGLVKKKLGPWGCALEGGIWDSALFLLYPGHHDILPFHRPSGDRAQ